MDRTISASEANQRFSELLHDVADGKSFTILLRGRPIARILPFECAREQPIEPLLDYVSRLPRRRSGAWRRDELYE